ncbi:MAG: hypothetical protein AABX54_05040 [Nanoarchaeota archaeon]
MRRHEKTRTEKQSRELGELEKSVREKLEKTGLVMHIRFHYGNLEENKLSSTKEIELNPEIEEEFEEPSEQDSENYGDKSYIEFRKNMSVKEVHGNCRKLKQSIFEAMTRFVPGVLGMDYQQKYPGVFRASPILYQGLKIENKKEYYIDMLGELDKLLEAYIIKNSPRKKG